MVRRLGAVILPLAVAMLGVVWMVIAVNHYRRTTGRQFYGLAGNHYSQPEWGFAYLPGGEAIEKWTVGYPPSVTLIALVTSAVVLSVRKRSSIWQVITVVAAHVVVMITFTLVAVWFWVNVMGLFI
jgi:hypothetical protein